MNLDATDLQRLLNWHECWTEAPLRQDGFTPQSVVDENWLLRMRVREELGRLDPDGLGLLPEGFAPPVRSAS